MRLSHPIFIALLAMPLGCADFGERDIGNTEQATHGGPEVTFELNAFGTYQGDNGKVKLKIQKGQVRDVMTLTGHAPVGAEQDFHFHEGAVWFVTVVAGTFDLYREVNNCAPTRYEPGDVFIEHSDNIHSLVNAGDTDGVISATGVLIPGNAITTVAEPDCN